MATNKKRGLGRGLGDPRQVGEDLRSHLPKLVYRVVIPRSVRLAEAPSHGRPIITYDISSSGAQAYLAMASEFLSRAGMRGTK